MKYFLIFALIVLSACDCIITVKGRIYDGEEGIPLQGAKIEMLGREISTTSKSDGSFEIYEVTGFCYDPEIQITLEGYKTFQIKFSDEGDYISYMVKSKLTYVDFENPVYPEPDNLNTFVTGTSIEQYSREFMIVSDSILVYLQSDNQIQEIEDIKRKLKNGS